MTTQIIICWSIINLYYTLLLCPCPVRALCSGMFISGDSLQCQQQLALFISERNGLMEATGMFRALVEGDANTRFFQTRASVRLRLSTRGWRRRGARTPVCRAEDGSSNFSVSGLWWTLSLCGPCHCVSFGRDIVGSEPSHATAEDLIPSCLRTLFSDVY